MLIHETLTPGGRSGSSKCHFYLICTRKLKRTVPQCSSCFYGKSDVFERDIKSYGLKTGKDAKKKMDIDRL